jgi:hypothetical protein
VRFRRQVAVAQSVLFARGLRAMQFVCLELVSEVLHITSMLHIDISNYLNIARFVVFMAVTIKDGVFWDVTPCGSCKNRRFGGT